MLSQVCAITFWALHAHRPLLLDAPMPYDAVATQDTELVSLTCGRWLSMLTSRPLPAQVAHLLLEMAEPGGNGELHVRLSQATIAHLLGARRQSVTRVLRDLRQHGCIDSRYGDTVVLDAEGLRSMRGGEPLPVTIGD